MQMGETMAYNIIFYENEKGESEVWDFLEKLRKKSDKDKNARIQYHQATLCIELLQHNGTLLPNHITKHIDENIWELRPGNHHGVKLKRQKRNAMIICPERRNDFYENLE